MARQRLAPSTARAFLLMILFPMMQRGGALPIQNETVDNICPSGTADKITHCRKTLDETASMGFPWTRSLWEMPVGSHKHNPLKDILSNLNHICQLFSRFQNCISEQSIIDYCLMIPPNQKLMLKVTFDFICNVEPRNENTFRSLQCLYDTRVMSLLYFHIGNECPDGPEILDNQMKVFKTAFFYTLDIPAAFCKRNNPPVIIDALNLPTAVARGCVKDIVERRCGELTGRLIVQFIEFLKKQNANALVQVGLSPLPADPDHIPKFQNNMSPSTALHTFCNSSGNLAARLHGLEDPRLELTRILLEESAGTALDTVAGKRLLDNLNELMNSTQPCSLKLLGLQFEVCKLFSIDKSEPPKYSILQAGHRFHYALGFGTQCSRLQDLMFCWNLTKEVCGPATRGFEHDIILQNESCHMQEYMESIECEWQDTMFDFYIQASRHSLWPTALQSGKPLYLDRQTFMLQEVTNSQHHLIYLLQAGVERIARICGQGAADRLLEVYRKLNYTLADAFLLELHVGPHFNVSFHEVGSN